MEIKDLIKEKRQELGLTYEQLGNLIGVGKSTVRKWETGIIENMRRDNIIALSKALNISPAILMGWDIKESNTQDKSNLNNISKEEHEHLEDLRKLNDLGKKKVFTYTKDLIDNPKFSSINNDISATNETEDFEPYLVACHDDNLTDEEKDIMNKKINEFLNKRK